MSKNKKMKQVAQKLAQESAKITGLLAVAVVFGFGMAPVTERGEQIDRRTNIKYMQERFSVLDRTEEDRQTKEYQDLKANIEACEKEYQEAKKPLASLPKWYQKYYSKIVSSADEYK